jgi:hypothetical protein
VRVRVWIHRRSRVIKFRPKVTDEILPANLGARDLVARCTSNHGETSFPGGFGPIVGQNSLEFGSGQPFVGAFQLKAKKNAHITAG